MEEREVLTHLNNLPKLLERIPSILESPDSPNVRDLSSSLFTLHRAYLQHKRLGRVLQDDEIAVNLFTFNDKVNKFTELKFLSQSKKSLIPSGVNVTEILIQLIHGQVKVYFENEDLTYGSGVLISPAHVLTIASGVFNDKKDPPKFITFFSYCEQKKRFTKPLTVQSISVPSQYLTDYSEKAENFNYALLTLASPAKFLDKDFTFPFMNVAIPQRGIQYSLFYFKEIIKKLETKEVHPEEEGKEEGSQFIFYKTETPLGSGGASLVAKIRDNYYLSGLHLGASLGDPAKKRSLRITPQIQETIAFMKNEASLFHILESWEEDSNRIELDLQGLPIKDIDTIHEIMKFVVGHPSIIHLNLSKTELNNDEIVDLASYLDHPDINLATLNLSHNHITDEGILYLLTGLTGKNDKLLHVNLEGNKISPIFSTKEIDNLLTDRLKAKGEIIKTAIQNKSPLEEIKRTLLLHREINTKEYLQYVMKLISLSSLKSFALKEEDYSFMEKEWEINISSRFASL